MNIGKSLRRSIRYLRAGFGMFLGFTVYPIAWLGWFRPRDPLAAAVADLLLLGFYGNKATSLSARLLARQVHRGQVGAVFFVQQNIGTIEDVNGLVHLFSAGADKPLLAIDHEGGIVQRLTPSHGFTQLPAARDVAALMSPDEARSCYEQAGRELSAVGFSINLGPVLDIDDPDNTAIGAFGRAFANATEIIAAYGQAFLDGFANAGILCAAKHFPGHGRAVDDSHDGEADISATWTEAELEPFARLISSHYAPPMIMTGHLKLASVETSGLPATVSHSIVTGLLRERLNYQGVVVTDDIDMGAVSNIMNREEAMVQAIAAGSDLIMIKNLFGYDPLLPQKAVGWVRKAITQGRLSEDQVMKAAERVRSFKCLCAVPISVE